MAHSAAMDRNLALEAVRVTEAAALAAARLMGRGDEKAADEAATRAMHAAFGSLAIDGTVVIGEGSSAEAPLLYVGERVGAGSGPKVDVALRPLEGISIIARGGHNALSVVAMAEKGGFLAVPGIYMDKIAVGGGLPEGVIDLDADPAENLKRLAGAKDMALADLVVCILDRPRHAKLISQVREAGARIRLILDGDVSGAIATARPESGVDVYMGIGGAPQGILAAAALRCFGGQMHGRLVFRSDADRAAARALGIRDPERKYVLADMASGDVTFAATGVTSGPLLAGVRLAGNAAVSYSMVMRSKSGTLRMIESHHDLSRRAESDSASSRIGSKPRPRSKSAT